MKSAQVHAGEPVGSGASVLITLGNVDVTTNTVLILALVS